MSKKKSGSIAIPFLLTFLVSLIIIGGAAMIIYHKINDDRNQLTEMSPEGTAISDADSHTILVMLDLSDTVEVPDETEETTEEDDENSDESSDDETYDWEVDETEEENKPVYPAKYTFMIMRSMPYHKQLVFVGLPDTMLVGEGNTPVDKLYESSGISAVSDAAEYSLDINIDKFVKMDSEAFRKLADIVGGANYVVPSGVDGFSESDDEQFIGPEDMEKLISYGGYAGGEIQRVSTAASLITAMINQASGERLASNLDSTYDTLINMVDSDISAMDYQDSKDAIKFMLKYSTAAEGSTQPAADDSENSQTAIISSGTSLAIFMTPYGSQSDGQFVMDSGFANDIAPYFDRPDQSSDSSSSQESVTEDSTNE